MLHAEFTAVALASVSKSSSPSRSSIKKPLLKVSLAANVYQRLLEAILSGALPGGEELNEVILARQLEVSRTPVHEALRRLAADGLVEALPNGKSRVVTFTSENVVALYEMRKILEGTAVEWAATRLEPERLTRLRQEADTLAAAPLGEAWPEQAISFDLHFHDVIAEASGNEFLCKDILRHRRLVQGFCRLTGTRENLRTAFEEHIRILEALEARDGAAARQAMVGHIEARLRTLLSMLESQMPTPSVSPA
jgi:DNA-binding GntR family transcriptional regulator